MNSTKPKRFEFAIILGIIAINLLFALIAIVYLVNSHTHYQDNLVAIGNNLAKLLDQSIADKARLIDDAVVRVERALERQMRYGGIDQKRLGENLDLEQQQLPEIDAIRITDAAGNVLFGKGVETGTNVSYADRAFFKKHQQEVKHGPIITEPLKGKVSGKWVIAFTRSYRTEDGTFAGVVTAAVPIETFEKVLASVNLGRRDTVVLRYADMGLIARVPTIVGPAGQPGDKKVSAEFTKVFESGSLEATFHTTQTPDSVERTYSFRRLSAWPFTIAVGLVDEEYLAPWKIQIIWVILSLGVVALVTSASAWMAVRYLREREITQEIIQDNEEKYRVVFNNEIYAICIFDLETLKLIDVNGAYTNLYGYSREELLSGMTIHDITAEHQVSDAATQQAIREGTIFIPVRYHRKKDGTVFPVEIVGGPYVWKGRKVMFGLAHDISDRKTAEEALIASEKRLFEIINASPVSMALNDAEMRITFLNSTFIQTFGYTQEDIPTLEHWWSKAYPDAGYRQKVTDAWQVEIENTLRMGGTFSPQEVIVKCKKGMNKTVLATATPFSKSFDDTHLVLLYDITDRKQAELERESALNLLKNIADQVPGIVYQFRLNPDGTSCFPYLSEAFRKTFGFNQESVSEDASKVFASIVAEDLDGVMSSIQKSAQDLTPWVHEFRLNNAEGAVRWVSGSSIPKRENDGSTLWHGIIIDVTERKQTEEALQQSEKRLALALKATQDAIWDWDLTSNTIYYSPRWWSIIGYNDNELVADPELWQRLMHPEDLERANRSVDQALAQGATMEVETRLLHKDGHYVPILTRGFILRDDQGKAIRIASTNTDLSEQKKIESERSVWERQQQQLKKADSLNRMAGAIAHHFNNQLGVVIGNLELAIEDKPRDGTLDRSLLGAMQGARNAADVSSSMLIYLGQTTGRHTPQDLSEICRHNLPLLQSAVPKEITLNVDLPVPGPTIATNENQIQQILVNLITNAYEAMSENQGAIDLIIKKVSSEDIPVAHRFPIDWQPQNNSYACLEVRDSGCGIAKGEIDMLFDPFFSSKFPGRGLGLAVVLGIVKAHNGIVTVESEQGTGSKFQVFLPISDEPCSQHTDQTTCHIAIEEKITVLLVEDEEMMRDLAISMLTRLGLKVLAAKDGVEAVEVFKNHLGEIRVVLTDLTMPRMNGWETLSALRRISPEIPVILMTGHNESTVFSAGHPDQPQAILHKPYKKLELQEALAEVIEVA